VRARGVENVQNISIIVLENRSQPWDVNTSPDTLAHPGILRALAQMMEPVEDELRLLV
jgi:hypothetical protein